MDALLNNPFVETLAWALVHSLWQFTLVGGLAFASVSLLKSAHQRHFAYLAALFSGAFLFGATTWYLIEPAVAVIPATGNELLVDFSMFQPSADGVEKSNFYSLLPYLVPAYLLGLIIIGLRTLIELMAVRQIRKQLLPATDRIGLQFEQLVQQLQPSQELKLRLSEAACSAITIGLFRPFIVFPVGLINQLSAEETEAILLHEIAHLIRNDHWWNAVQVLVGNLFFYHPIVHWICRRMDAEREYACDDYVVNRLDRRIYAQSLLNVAQFSITHKNQFIMQAQGKSEFSQRIQRLFLTEPDQRRPKVLLFLPLILLIAAGFQYGVQEDTEQALLSNIDVATLKSEKQAASPLDTFPKNSAAADDKYQSIFGNEQKIYFVDDKRITPQQSLDLEASLKENPLHMMTFCKIEDDPEAMKLAKAENKPYFSVVRIYTSEDKVPAKMSQQDKTDGQRSTSGRTDLDFIESKVDQKKQSAAPHASPTPSGSFTTNKGTPIHADLFGAERTYENTVVIINGKRQMGNTLGDLSKLSIESMNVIKGEDRVTAKGYPGYPAMIELVVNKPGTREPMEITEPSVNELLEGKKAGIDITNTENRKIRLNSRNVRDTADKVLFVLDGEVYESGTMDDIDPATISSIEVVKGVDQIAALGFGTEYTGAVLIFTSNKSKRKFDRQQKSKPAKKKEKPYYKIIGKVADNPNTVFILNGEVISKEQLFKTRQNGEVVTFITITERSTLEKKGYDSSVSGVIEIVEENN